MNLHGIAGPMVGAVNPNIVVKFEASAGYTKDSAFRQVPSFAPSVDVLGQVQALTMKDLQHIEAMNIQQSTNSVYLYGTANGVVRVREEGGDRITVPSGPSAGVYKVTSVLEQWPDWVKVSVVLQNLDVT
jgi:hypothetical protein